MVAADLDISTDEDIQIRREIAKYVEQTIYARNVRRIQSQEKTTMQTGNGQFNKVWKIIAPIIVNVVLKLLQ